MKYLGRGPGGSHQAVYTCVQERTAAPSAAEHLAVLSSMWQDHRHRQRFNGAESGDGQVEIQDGPSSGPPSWLHCPGHPLRRTMKAVRFGRPLFPAFSLVVMESVFVGIYLHCNQKTCFEMFSLGGL